jgi:tetratricopeptide (TPR) repeat protein
MRLLPEVRNLMGNYHVKSGIYHFYRDEYKQAVDFFRKALKDEPSLSDGDLRMARYYLTQTFVHSAERLAAKGDLEAATRDYSRAAEVSPDFPDIRYRLGKTLEALDRHEEAIHEYRHAVALNDRYGVATTALAFCLLRAGRHAEAADAFSEVFELRVRRIREPFEKGLQRLREGMASEAEEFFQEAFLASARASGTSGPASGSPPSPASTRRSRSFRSTETCTITGVWRCARSAASMRRSRRSGARSLSTRITGWRS